MESAGKAKTVKPAPAGAHPKVPLKERIPALVTYLTTHEAGTPAELAAHLNCSATVIAYTIEDAQPAIEAARLTWTEADGNDAVTKTAKEPARQAAAE